VKDPCGNNVWFNPITQFCQIPPTKVQNLCGGTATFTSIQRCENNVVEDQCGSKWYDASNMECRNGVIYAQCAGVWYNTQTHHCSHGVIVPFCGINPQSYDTDLYECRPPSNGIYLIGGITDSRDGKHYEAVLMGTQVWMAEELNYNANGSRCYNNNNAYCNTYVRQYNYTTALSGVCPTGWHLPSNDEWNVLMKFVDPSCNNADNNYNCPGVGVELKATSGWTNDQYPGRDTYGFYSLPDPSGTFNNWWSSSPPTYPRYTEAYYRGTRSGSSSLWSGYVRMDGSFLTVRCVKD